MCVVCIKLYNTKFNVLDSSEILDFIVIYF